MAADEATVLVDRSDDLAVVRLRREHGNAIDETLAAELGRTFRELEGDGSLRGVLLTSGRPGLFCPGLDLRELVGFDRERMGRFMETFSATLATLYGFPRPVVAGLSGHAVAGGCVLALTADRRILREGALVGLAEVAIGVPLPLSAALILREAVHRSRLEEVALLGRNYTNGEAVAAGLVHEVHGEEGFEEHCLRVLCDHAEKAAEAFAVTKRHLRAATLEHIRRDDRRRLEVFLDVWFSPETRRRIEELAARLAAKDPDGGGG